MNFAESDGIFLACAQKHMQIDFRSEFSSSHMSASLATILSRNRSEKKVVANLSSSCDGGRVSQFINEILKIQKKTPMLRDIT